MVSSRESDCRRLCSQAKPAQPRTPLQVVAAANWTLGRAEESAGVAAGLQAAAAAVGADPAAFIETFNKSVPTALGLLGERKGTAGRSRAAGELPRGLDAAVGAAPMPWAVPDHVPPPPTPPPPAHAPLNPQPSPSLCTLLMRACTRRSTPACAPSCAATSASRRAARRRGWPSARAAGRTSETAAPRPLYDIQRIRLRRTHSWSSAFDCSLTACLSLSRWDSHSRQHASVAG